MVGKGFCCAIGREGNTATAFSQGHIHTLYMHDMSRLRKDTASWHTAYALVLAKSGANCSSLLTMVLYIRRFKQPLIRTPWSSPSICWCPDCSPFYRLFSRTDSLGQLCRLCWKYSTGEGIIWTSHSPSEMVPLQPSALLEVSAESAALYHPFVFLTSPGCEPALLHLENSQGICVQELVYWHKPTFILSMGNLKDSCLEAGLAQQFSWELILSFHYISS